MVRETMKNTAEEDKLGLYIHIPFCRSKCDYCDFYSLAGRESRMDDYQRALLAHLRASADAARGVPVDTVYFGGGTPSFYGAGRLSELLAAVRDLYTVEEDAEITAEANPDSADGESLEDLRKAGFSRISLGMQSADPEELRRVHRPHTVLQTLEAVTAARRAGFWNLSLDLICGLPGQTEESWRRTVETALKLGPEHLSCYGLIVEPGTPLSARAVKGEKLPEDDLLADLYIWTVERLERAGLAQYEISNFAKPGCASRHNMRYWLMRPYLGFGPGAHSDFGGRRWSYARDLDGYIRDALTGGARPEEEKTIPLRERAEEYLMLRLRTVRGVDAEEYSRMYRLDFRPLESRFTEFREQGWAARTPEGRWRFTPKGFLVSNELIAELLLEQEKTGEVPAK